MIHHRTGAASTTRGIDSASNKREIQSNPFQDGRARNVIRKGPLYTGLLVLVLVPMVVWNSVVSTTLPSSINDSSLVEIYKGTTWQSPQTLGKRILGATPFARCDVHTVQVSEHKIVKDWIFMEERDAVNVAVLDYNHTFLVFRQRKYAIPGDTLAPVGGFIEDKETPWQAAQREVWEELGVGSLPTQQAYQAQGSKLFEQHSETPVVDEYGLKTGVIPESEQSQWVFLGRYRTMANRGGGFIYCFLLKGAVPLVDKGGTAKFGSTGDEEAQTILTLSPLQLRTAVQEGRFGEIKWAATMSLALQRMDVSSF